MQIEELKVSDIIPYENNPRRNDAAVEAVANSIKEFGFLVPIVIDKDNVIAAGHTRLKAAEKLGLETVPVIRAENLTEKQINAFRLADNKTGELAELDFEKLEEEISMLDNIDLRQFGFEPIKDDEFEPINDSAVDATNVTTHYISIDNKKIELMDDEYEMLIDKMNAYSEENKVLFGFVRWILNG